MPVLPLDCAAPSAMADVGVTLGIDAKELYQELQNVTAKFVTFSQQTAQAGNQAGGGFFSGIKKALGGVGTGISEFFSGIGGTISGFLGAGAIVAEIQSVIHKADEIHETSSRFGLDAEQLQRLANAGKTAGLDMDQMGRAMTLLTINAQKALDPMSKQAIATQQLAINAQQFAKLNPEEQYLRLADAYRASARDGAAFAAVSDLIGRRNTAQITLLKQGSEGIKEQAKAFHTLSNQEVADLHRISVEEDKYFNLLHVSVGKAVVGWGVLARAASASLKDIKDNVGSSFSSISSTIGALQNPLSLLGGGKNRDALKAEIQKSVRDEEPTAEGKDPTKTAVDIKDELKDEKKAGKEKDDSDIGKIRELSRPKTGVDDLKKLADEHEKESDRAESANAKNAEALAVAKEITNEMLLRAKGDEEGARKAEIRAKYEKEIAAALSQKNPNEALATELKKQEEIALKGARPAGLVRGENESGNDFLKRTGRIDASARPATIKEGLETGHVQAGSLADPAGFQNAFHGAGQHLDLAQKLKEASGGLGKDAHAKPAEKLDKTADKWDKVADKLEKALHI